MARESTEIREPLGEALDEQLRAVELAVLRVWQVTAAVGIVFALVVAFTLSRALGLGTATVGAVLFAWFTLTASVVRRGKPAASFTMVSTVAESLIPWITLLLLVRVQGAGYALGSWLPPMLFAALIVAAVARLRPVIPLVVGLSSAAAFLTLYFVSARPALDASQIREPLFGIGMQLSRATSLVFAGFLGMLVARGLRGAIGRAESDVRSKDLFGKYRITRQIASGGMGAVHEAIYCPEGGFERRVAIKRVHPHLVEQPESIDAFRQEAELSARLVHTNIVQVFDFGRVGETYFLAMEYVDGLTLQSLLRRAFAANLPIPLDVVAHIGREVLSGLCCSHEEARGGDGSPLRIIHRDLSPANVLVSKSGEVKISDFGLARALRDAESARTKHVAGHVGYMAPEQVLGHPLDPRCDLFGLGVVLWELLAGRRLFLRENESATLFAMVTDPVPAVSAFRSEVDATWDRFLDHALERDPDQRFASASEMAAALDAMAPPLGRQGSEALARLVAVVLELPERRKNADSEAVTRVDAAPTVSSV